VGKLAAADHVRPGRRTGSSGGERVAAELWWAACSQPQDRRDTAGTPSGALVQWSTPIASPAATGCILELDLLAGQAPGTKLGLARAALELERYLVHAGLELELGLVRAGPELELDLERAGLELELGLGRTGLELELDLGRAELELELDLERAGLELELDLERAGLERDCRLLGRAPTALAVGLQLLCRLRGLHLGLERERLAPVLLAPLELDVQLQLHGRQLLLVALLESGGLVSVSRSGRLASGH
jgi:hypothetical protein